MRRKYRILYKGIMIFVMLFMILGMKKRIQEEDTEIFQAVTESDLENLMADKNDKIANEETNKDKQIRVLIMGNGYKGEIHPKVILSSEGNMQLTTENKTEDIKKGKKLIVTPDDERFADGVIRISAEKKIELKHLERGYGTPSYEGEIELWKTAEGIAIINEISVEKYLKAVVPSEMPASYELEALKSQAVCARSYAYRQMEEYGYPEYKAHVNDSTDYQVYGNSKPQKSTNRAVKETKGEVVYYQDEIATTYYYSTSCGKTTDVTAWGSRQNEKNRYLQSVKVSGEKGDYEKELPWYRWNATISIETMSNIIGLNIGKDIGLLKNIKVTKRGSGDVVTEIEVTGEDGTAVIKTENKIRKALGGDEYTITLQDGTKTTGKVLLPSAFFNIKRNGDNFVIDGGGFGHGIGMSQNGANEMAKQGKDYKEILEMFYYNIEVR